MRRSKKIKQSFPWILSIGIHCLLFLVAFAFTWSYENKTVKEIVVVSEATEDAFYREVVYRVSPDVSPMVSRPPLEGVSLIPLPDVKSPLLQEDFKESIRVDSLDLAPSRPFEEKSAAQFLGMVQDKTGSIVYVIDASASMLVKFPFVIKELYKSLRQLQSSQKYQVIFFQEDRAIGVPPEGLKSASLENVKNTMRWIGYTNESQSGVDYQNKNIIPQLASDPVPALTLGLSLEPDVLFLLSDNITGSGAYKIDPQQLLDFLDNQNPITRGIRRTRIMTIQFFDNDPLRTLEKIAISHGGGDGFVFLGSDQFVKGRVDND